MFAVSHRYHIEGLHIGAPNASPREVENTRKALQEGRDILRREGQPQPSLRALVWRLLQDAVETLARVRDPDLRFLLAGERIGWPEVVHTEQERFEAEVQRLTDLKMSKEQVPLPRLAITDTTAERRMHTVLGWLRHVRGRKSRRDQRIALELAANISVVRVRNRYLGKDFTDSAIRMVKDKVLQHICEALSNFT